MKKTSRLRTPIFVLLFLLVTAVGQAQPYVQRKDVSPDQSIMLALLLDTSNSMDGLIDQAKSQLWKIVNELSAAKCSNGARPRIKIALYEYGNDRLSASTGYIRMVSPLTTDLDVISEKLFALTTNGGNEFCGQVIKSSLNQLTWSASAADLKMIFIAGNEPFTQGEIPFRTACSLANEKGVVVNTIFCGDFNEGVGSSWKTGADLTGGTYMSLEQDRKTVYIPTPYDERIDVLNEKLNETYVYYGSQGSDKKRLQKTQDDNAASYSRSNKVERAVSKSSGAYSNSVWDLVDASKESEEAVAKSDAKDLPAEMKGMSIDQRKAYVKQKAADRQKIQTEIQSLSRKRQEFITSNTPKDEQGTSLDGTLIKAIKERAKSKNISWN
jgi:von Willebrand factor type A domain